MEEMHIEDAPAAEPVEMTQAQPAPKPKSVPAHQPAPSAIENTAKTLSAVFSPLIVPTYACAMALWLTTLSLTDEKARFVVCAAIFVITTVLPLAWIIFMMRVGRVSDPAISNRNERAIPFLITGLCYLGAAIYLGHAGAPAWLRLFFLGAMAATIIALLINFAWKISAHMMTMGGVVGMLFFVAYHHINVVPMLPWLAGAIIVSGMVGSARVQLGRHTPAQVYGGFVVGALVVFLTMSLQQWGIHP